MEIQLFMNYNEIIIKEKLLIIEIGNSRLKVDNGEIIQYYDYTFSKENINETEIIKFLNNIISQLKPSKIYYSSVNPLIENIIYINFNAKNINNFISLAKIDFSDIQGMGIDRKLGLIAANELYGENILTIDCGTAQTYNLLINNKCLGGFITPGLITRLKSLFENTDIPYQDIDNFNFNDELGSNTKDAISNGVYFGLLSEIKYFINKYSVQYPELKAVITGGNSLKLYNSLKESEFSLILQPNLVNDGIKVILSKIYDK